MNDPAQTELFPNLTPDQRAIADASDLPSQFRRIKIISPRPWQLWYKSIRLACRLHFRPSRTGLVISIQAGSVVDGTSFNLAGSGSIFDVRPPVQFPNLDGLAL